MTINGVAVDLPFQHGPTFDSTSIQSMFYSQDNLPSVGVLVSSVPVFNVGYFSDVNKNGCKDLDSVN